MLSYTALRRKTALPDAKTRTHGLTLTSVQDPDQVTYRNAHRERKNKKAKPMDERYRWSRASDAMEISPICVIMPRNRKHIEFLFFLIVGADPIQFVAFEVGILNG